MIFRYSKLIKLHSNHKSCFVEVGQDIGQEDRKRKRFKLEALPYSDPGDSINTNKRTELFAHV